jgi:hypothetical protein
MLVHCFAKRLLGPRTGRDTLLTSGVLISVRGPARFSFIDTTLYTLTIERL